MSDVIVSTTESTTNVTTVNDVTTIAITNNVVEVSQATAGLQGVPGSNSDPTYVFVTNKTGSTLAKGSIVYVSGANGVHTQVSLALATGDITSARTLGWLAENIANNATGLCCVEGYLDGVDTQGVTEGAQLYLSPTTPGAFTETKPQAPDHMVYVGFCSKASAGNGRVFVFVQNGAELEELHDVKIVSPQNNDLLRYVSGTALWENVAATAITVGSAITAGTSVYATNSGTSVYASTAGTSVYATNAGTAVDLSGSITKSQVSDFTSGTVASASTAQQAGTAVYATTSGSASVSGSAVAYTGSITISQITDLANATVTSASTAQQAGTSVYASTAGTSVYATLAGTASYATAALSATSSNSAYTALLAGTSVYAATAGTADYATTSGTSVSISGSITRSQVSDYASGTVANISGTVTQAQVSNLTTDLAGKANLAGGNSFTGAQIVETAGTANIGLVVKGTASQSADLLQAQNSGSTALFKVFSTGGVSATGSAIVVNGASWPFTITQSASSTATITNGGVVRITSAPTGTTRFEADATAIPVIIRGASGQANDFFSIQNSGGTALARANLNGSFFFGQTTGSYPTFFGASGSLAGMINVVPASAAVIPIIVRGAASQTADALQLQDSGGNTYLNMSVFGGISSNLSGAYPGRWSVGAGVASTIPLVIRGASGQTADLLQIQNSGGTVLAKVGSTGDITAGYAYLSGLRDVAGSGAYINTTSTNVLLNARTATNKGLVIQGASSQSANLQEWQTSAGGTASSVDAFGNAGFGGTAASSSFGLRVATNANPAVIGIAVVGAASQTANLQEWRNSAASVLTRIASGGGIFTGQNSGFGGRVTVGSETVQGAARLVALATSATDVPFAARGFASQTANLQEWQNSGGTVLASIGNTGDLTAPAVRTSSDYVVAGGLNNGGSIRIFKSDAAGAPPSNYVRLQVLAGTNANTLKLVAVGPNGSAITILDNLA